MAGVFGNLDLNQMIAKIGDSFGKIMPATDPFPQAQVGGHDPFGTIGLGAGGDPFGGVGFGGGGDPFGGFQQNQTDPFPQAQIGGRDPFGSFNLSHNDPFGSFGAGNSNPFGSFGLPSDPWAGRIQTAPSGQTAAEAAYAAGKAQGGQPGQAGGASWLGTGTGSDNAGLTAEKINGYIASRPGSPLAGMGDFILKEANAKGISVPQLLGIMTLESGLGTEQGTLPGVYNYGGLTGTGWGGQTGNTTGMARAFAMFDSKESGIRALIDNLATDKYRGKSVQQQIGTWYLGNPDAGLDAADEKGNATMRQYLGTIASVYAALGLTPDFAAAPTQQPGAKGGGAGMGSIWGGLNASVTQEIGPTDFSNGNSIYDYGSAYGVSGHTGLDIGLARGSKLYMPAGFSGTVTTAGGTPYFRDEDYGDQGTPGKGELKITLDNGWQLILGHTSQINVQAGQRVTAGDLVGLSGTANGDHLHLELRIPDASLASGYRIVDPRQYFK